MKNHNWTTIAIEVMFDGVLLKGQVRYWAKDYEVDLIEPFKAQRCSHLMYVIPARFTNDEPPRDGIRDIDVATIAREVLVALYKENNTEGIS